MALESPLKRDIEKASRAIDTLNRLYNVYFQGGEEDPPRAERKALETLIDHLKTQISTATNASDRFQANSMVMRFQTMKGRWDKILRGIENGTIPRQKKRD
jgi:hypothetical protein